MKKLLFGLVLAMIPLVMFGCGSGDYGSGGGTTISGVASKGPITGGKVAIFSVTTSARIGKQLATGTTGSGGIFTANLGAYTGAIFATMSGSSASYTDEATNTVKTLGTTKLHAATVIVKSGPFNLAITPLTELAYQKAATLKPADIVAANTLISKLFLAGTDIISTLPADISNSAPAVTDPDKIKYSLALAVFSQLLTTNSVDIGGGITLLNTGISGGTLPAAWTAAVSALAANSTFTANFQSGILTAPASIAFSSPTYSAIINQPVTITANVTKFDGTPVPVGTKVTFTASGGALGTPTATDASGNATVVLTPSAVGTITVNASATASGVTVSTKTAAVVTVVTNPNDPGTVTLAASPSSVVAGQSVTLNAIVGVVGGGPSNVTKGSAPNPVATVTFKITSGMGTLSAATATTNASGVATVTLTSGTVGTVTVTASAGTTTPVTSSPATVTFTPDPLAPATVTVSAAPTSIPADGTTASTITATVTNYLGAALSGATVTFTTTGGTLGTASAATTNANGTVTIPLTSASTGSGTVTASATAASVTKTGSATVTFTAIPPRPTTAIVTLATSGTFTTGTAVGTVDVGVTFSTTKGLTLTNYALSGVATTITPVPTVVANVPSPGSALLTLTANTSSTIPPVVVGMPIGIFATFTFSIASGTPLPVASDFTITPGSAAVDNTVPTVEPNITVIIQSVTFQ